jgi:hypothetical protein
LPIERTAWIDWLRSRIHFEIPLKSRGVQFMKVIRTGIVECRRIRLTHIGVGDKTPDRHDVNPYGVVYHHDVWYLLGFDCNVANGVPSASTVSRPARCLTSSLSRRRTLTPANTGTAVSGGNTSATLKRLWYYSTRTMPTA